MDAACVRVTNHNQDSGEKIRTRYKHTIRTEENTFRHDQQDDEKKMKEK